MKNSDISTYPILVVDDNMKNLQVLGKILKQEGYPVEFATSGENALEWIHQQDFNLILLDIMMPGMSGFEVCEQLQKDETKKDIPVIFLTSKTDEESIVKGFDLGAIDYVTKPFNKKELLARVSTQLKIKQSQREISYYLKELETKNKLITYSIRYAEHIQKTILDLHSEISKFIPEYFIYFKPKDIVSGDFFWFYETDILLILAVMDCTGHGVPGAMMSMMGITLLNEIIKNNQIIKAAQLLNKLRDKIIEALGQKGIVSEVSDGMDGSILLIEKGNKKIHYAGAFSNMYMVRNHELQMIKGDRMPVSHDDILKDFTNQEVSVEKGDMLYLYTDGYVDQFGGTEDKKFKHNSFTELLLEIHEKSASEQKEILSATFENWKGQQEQVDDVTVLGVRI
jgi:sigma-B regulation protein RsbU (phosphoserine phosphatase)